MTPRMFTKEDYNPSDLLQAGLDHLKGAEILLGQSPELFDSAGYLAHMGLELMLKSWILHSLGKIKGIHSLEALVKEIQCSNCRLCLTKRELQTLSYLKSFEELRYPSIRTPVEIGSEDVELIYDVANAIWQQMPSQLIDDYEQIPLGRKGGRVYMRRPKNITRDLNFEAGITA
jgi:HEPN domain-containing protein